MIVKILLIIVLNLNVYAFAFMIFPRIKLSSRITNGYVGFTRYFKRMCTTSSHEEQSSTEAYVPKKFTPFPFNYHEILEIKIDELTNLGMGVGRKTLDSGTNWVIMVAYALPGERIMCRIFKNYKTYSEADIVEILEPSKYRVIPRCKYFTICTGCQYQHIPVNIQRSWKKKQVLQVLQRIGG
jgi:hypothetical protein